MIWILVLIPLIILIFIVKPFIEKKELEKILCSFRKKERVMNESEQALFINLQKCFGEGHVVLSKVRIEDFVEVDNGQTRNKNDRWGMRNRIKSRHVDFLICERATTKPLLAIELDGKSHNNIGRKERDQFVDELYKAIDLPIKHIAVGEDFIESAQDCKSALENNVRT